MKRIKVLTTLFLISIFVIGTTYVSGQDDSVEFSLTVDNLANPGEDHYEGWLITDDGAVPAGKFSVNDAGEITDLDGDKKNTFTIDGVNLDDVTDYVITLEPSGDDNDQPADIKPVAGKLNSDKTSASLSINIDADFSSISGDYILATPTDNNTDTNENAGIWYLSLESGSPTVGFDLPDLSGTSWTYEGWVIIDGTPLTTGTFDDFNVVDNADPYSDSVVSGPPFPGEDYLKNAPSGLTFPVDLAGEKTAITIEPRMDNSDAPFQFHPLEDDIPSDATDHQTYQMEDITNTFPTGMVEFMDTSDEDGLPGNGLALTLLSVGIVVAIRNREKLNS